MDVKFRRFLMVHVPGDFVRQQLPYKWTSEDLLSMVILQVIFLGIFYLWIVNGA